MHDMQFLRNLNGINIILSQSDKFQHTFMVKALMKLGIEGMYLNIMKAMYDKPIVNIILNGEKLKPLPGSQEQDKGI
jgi:hypothetical protein